jgi:hypothetical protein
MGQPGERSEAWSWSCRGREEMSCLPVMPEIYVLLPVLPVDELAIWFHFEREVPSLVLACAERIPAEPSPSHGSTGWTS